MAEKTRIKTKVQSSITRKSPKEDSKKKLTSLSSEEKQTNKEPKIFKIHNSKRIKSEIEKKITTDDYDLFHFTKEKSIPETSRKRFPTFFELKKLIYNKPVLSELFKKYKTERPRSHYVYHLRFTASFITYLIKETENHPIIQKNLLQLIEKINSDNEIYKYIEERIKNGITSTYGEFAISVFSGYRAGAKYPKEIALDIRSRNEIRLLGRSLKDENVEKYWDEFVLHNPISRSRLERYQEFAIFLQNNANKFDVNDKTLERIVNWAENRGEK